MPSLVSRLLVLSHTIFLVILILLTAIAGYVYSRVRTLSLPIPQALALLTVLLPLLSGLSTLTIEKLISKSNKPRRLGTIVILLVLQLIYETVIATLSSTYLVPSSTLSCGLGDKWSSLFHAKNEAAIRTIQDAFECCGFHTVQDRGWPFPSKKFGAGYCASRYNRKNSCEGAWRQAEQINAGLLVLIAGTVFIVKVANLTVYLTRPAISSSQRNSKWLGPFQRLIAGPAGEEEDGFSATRRLIEEPDAEVEPYHDVADEPVHGTEATGSPVYINGNGNESRERVEPSGIVGAAEEWRDG